MIAPHEDEGGDEALVRHEVSLPTDTVTCVCGITCSPSLSVQKCPPLSLSGAKWGTSAAAFCRGRCRGFVVHLLTKHRLLSGCTHCGYFPKVVGEHAPSWLGASQLAAKGAMFQLALPSVSKALGMPLAPCKSFRRSTKGKGDGMSDYCDSPSLYRRLWLLNYPPMGAQN